MKKIITMILCCILLMSSFYTTISASTDPIISPYYNNASSTSTKFNIINGEACVNVSYIGNSNAFTEARIYVKLEKRTLLLFWNDITEWETVSYNAYDAFEYRYPVENGTYRATVRIEISGTNGATDVIEKEIKAST